MKKFFLCCFGKFRNNINETNFAIRSLLIIGTLALVQTILTVFITSTYNSTYDIVIRSIMSNVFGYFFGSESQKISNNRYAMLRRQSKDDITKKELTITSYEDDNNLPENYYTNYKKDLQIAIASVISIICLLTIMLASTLKISPESAANVEIRNLMFASVGFLLSRAREEK